MTDTIHTESDSNIRALRRQLAGIEENLQQAQADVRMWTDERHRMLTRIAAARNHRTDDLRSPK